MRDPFLDLVRRIEGLMSYDFTLHQIHTQVIDDVMNEYTFFLAYKAATLRIKWRA